MHEVDPLRGDAEAFALDLAGDDTSATRERILGIKTLGPKSKGVNNKDAKARSSAEVPDRIILDGNHNYLGLGDRVTTIVKGDAKRIVAVSPTA